MRGVERKNEREGEGGVKAAEDVRQVENSDGVVDASRGRAERNERAGGHEPVNV